MAMQLTPYLTMDGNAKEAIAFYKEALEAEIIYMQTFGEMPENPEFPLPPEMKDRVSYASLKVGESEFMFSDAFPGQKQQMGGMLSICLTTDDVEKTERIFNALCKGGIIEMPLQKTFFSPAYGMVTDKFGVLFQVFTKALQ
ncbi:VOC family protein [Paenibacillus sp. FSL R5-0407]|uniref:VOC family protein n=1 Tax=Paenibacillus sp. FSL R5-0407 TaxID=2975320 RepID=UPI0030FC5BFA